MRENAPVGTVITELGATDRDSEEMTELTYRLDELVADRFEVTAEGTLVTKTKLDREEKPFYSFYVTVADSPDPKKRLTTKCLVEVRDLYFRYSKVPGISRLQ